jgi:pimeloyl-ACP methyl ester carboxylesterase
MLNFPTQGALASRQESAFTRPWPATEIAIGSRIEGDGPAIVLLHSSMGSKSQWRRLTECMRGAYRLIAIDLHGYGDSAMPRCAGQFSLADEVLLVQSKLAQVLAPDECFHLVGHSFGGGVALRLAHASPERLRSLSLYEPTAFHLLDCGDPALEEVRGLAGAVEAAMHNGDRFGATELFIDYWSGVGTHAALPPARQALFACLLPKVLLDFQALFNDPLRAADYGHIPVPTCLIVGRHSPECVRAIASILAAVIANRETHEIDAGHMAPLTHPAIVNPIIDGFIRDVGAHGGDPSTWKKPEAFPSTRRLMGV